MKNILKPNLLATLLLACSLAAAQSPAGAPPPVRLRGTVEKFEPPRLTIKERSGELITLVLAENLALQEVLPIDIASIEPGAFIGTAAAPNAAGALEALEVVVFPEAARGTGEGHYPWDLSPHSTMTNATVAHLARSAQGRTLTLRYREGEKAVLVPDGVPVVTFKPAGRELIQAGAKVFVVAALRDGQPTAMRLIVGRNGFTPPM